MFQSPYFFPPGQQQQTSQQHPNIFQTQSSLQIQSSSTSIPHFIAPFNPPVSPFNLEDLSWVQKPNESGPEENSVVRFHAQRSIDDGDRRYMLHHKRKITNNFESSAPPVKQFISEEKITAHFNGLHISNNYIQANASGAKITDNQITEDKCLTNYEDYQITARELEEKLLNASCILFCEDLQKFNDNEKKRTLLPEALLNRVEKPCTALVLWKPQRISDSLQRKNDDELVSGRRDERYTRYKNLQNNMFRSKDSQPSTSSSDDSFIECTTSKISSMNISSPDDDSIEINDVQDNNNTLFLNNNKIHEVKTDYLTMDEDL